jgi:hypothetical protein
MLVSSATSTFMAARQDGLDHAKFGLHYGSHLSALRGGSVMFTAALRGVLGFLGRIILLSVLVQFARSLLFNQHQKTFPFFPGRLEDTSSAQILNSAFCHLEGVIYIFIVAMGAAESTSVLEDHQRLIERFTGKDAIPLDDAFWNELLAFPYPLSKLNPQDVDTATRQACAQLGKTATSFFMSLLVIKS